MHMFVIAVFKVISKIVFTGGYFNMYLKSKFQYQS